MSATNEVVNALDDLASALERRGAAAVAQFFRERQELFATTTEVDLVTTAADELSRAGAISQYGNFSAKEDELFARVFRATHNLLRSLER